MSLQIALQNQSTSNTVYCYITGQAIDNNNALFLLESDGQTPYYPQSPSSTVQPLQANCAIPLGAPGNTVYATIPHIAGGRLWFSIDNTLDFYLNPGPGLVEPSSNNPSDSNYNKNWGFCEFTFNSGQLYANISYVDFVSIPIALTLTNSSNQTQHVSGMPADGFQKILSALQDQSRSDGQPWGSMVYNNLRIVSPNSYIGMNSSAFQDYYSSYVNQCWQKYSSSDVKVNTQAQWGVVSGSTSNNTLSFGSGGSFAQPSAADIFSNSTGPFAGGPNVSAEQLNIGARLVAALNRSTLLSTDNQPDGGDPSQYYQTNPTNHYARVVHANNLDGRGYAFPYDDVTPPGGQDQSGYLSDGSPQLWTVAVGGSQATANVDVAHERQTKLMQDVKKVSNMTVQQQIAKLHPAAASKAVNRSAMREADEPAPDAAAAAVPEFTPAVAKDAPPAAAPKQNMMAKIKGLFSKCFSKRK